MPFDKSKITIDPDTSRLGAVEMTGAVAHVLCEAGTLEFRYNGQNYTLHEHECMIVRVQQLFEHLQRSPQLVARCIYITPDFIEICTPKNNYGIRGSLALFANPIMPLNPVQFERMKRDFDYMAYRYNENDHLFQDDVMIGSTQVLFLDFYDVHAKLYGHGDVVTEQNASIVGRFIALLQDCNYVKHREVSWYADRLFVTSKYLSEVCKNTSGHAANYWINRFATIHIRRLLAERKLTLTQISDQFGFSSPAYFSRYVQKNLGRAPSALRE